MQRSLARTLVLGLAAGLLAAPVIGCAPGEKVGGSGGSGNGTGGRAGTGGTGTPGTGGTGTPGTGGTGTPGTGGTGTPGTGGTGTPGTGGTGTPGTGGTGTPGTGGRGGSTGTGGTGPGTGGGAAGGARACAIAPPPGAVAADVISDFEDGYAIMIKQGGRTGYWTTYNNTADPQTQMPAKPAAAMADKVPVEPAGTCMMSAYHSSATGQDNYVGFGAQFKPNMPLTMSNLADPYDVSQWDGITFRAKTGGSPAMQPVFVEILTKDTQPTTAGGTATVQAIDLYNNRGYIANVSSTTLQQFFVPFGALFPRSLPSPGASGCPAAAGGGPKCQAPAFNPLNALAIQFSFYGPMDTPGFPNPSPVGSYNLFIDDVAFYKRSALPSGMSDMPALPSSGGMHPLQASPTINARCTKAAGANGRLIALAYDNWKKRFVVSAGGGVRVQRPENNNDSVSEGIAYGMLIAVYMDDKALFDGLWTYWKANPATSEADGPLMTWQIPGGSGTATDADEDAAFAMLMASKQWSGGSYAADATRLIQGVRKHDMSGTFIKGGSNYTTGQPTNPSYFAPAFYRAFARADAANASAWNGLADGAYTLLTAIAGTSSNGLYAAWCGSNCSQIATNTGSANPAEDVLYQYDSHRIPWRIGMDYCWNGTAAAKTYVDKTSAFFSSASRGGGGVGRIYDKYNPNGTDVMGASFNSASIIGTAASGAMANSTYATFVNDGYQLTLDLLNRGEINDRAATSANPPVKSAYSYYNATVGLLMLLTMNGNFQDWTQ
jgi:endo-1,4-beta-D-glucanase Y